MINQLAHSFFLFGILFLSLAHGIRSDVRFYGLVFLFFGIFITYQWAKIRNQKILINSWISSEQQSKSTLLLGISLILVCFLSIIFSPKVGISVLWSTGAEYSIKNEERIDVPTFKIIPSLYPRKLALCDDLQFRISAKFKTNEPIHAAQFYLERGNATWYLDGDRIANHKAEEVSRFFFIQRDINAGIHLLECEIQCQGPPPVISMMAALGADQEFRELQGPFFPIDYTGAFQFSQMNVVLFFLIGILSFILICPTLNLYSKIISNFILKRSPLSFFIGFLVVLGFLFYYNIQMYDLSRMRYEADEAAFGLMAQELDSGQSPPLFHYGQQYQGTIESIPLSIFINYTNNNIKSMLDLTILWQLTFLLVTVYCFWIYGNPALSLFALFFFAIGGLHYHWIFHKCWFGYSFSLACGAFLFLIALHAYDKQYLSPVYAFLWGAIAGLSLYELPISLPFVMSTFSILLFVVFREGQWDSYTNASVFNWLSCQTKNGYRFICKNNLWIAFISLFLFTSPYWLTGWIGGNEDALRFLTEGRELAAPRVTGEDPFIDRFFGECLPVFLGIRAPYEQFNDPPNIPFPAFPSVFFMISVCAFLFLSRRILPDGSIFQNPILRYSVGLLSVITIVLGVYSPFGIWPWYFLPLYWALPVLLFTCLSRLWKWAPSFSALAFILYFLPIILGLELRSPFLFQASSLSASGLSIPTDFSKIIDTLKQEQIQYLLCDQGFDVNINDAGRDWLGECITFASSREIRAIDRLSRRVPVYAQEIMNAGRIGYLFHKHFFYSNLSLAEGNINGYAPLSISNIEELFGPRLLNYKKYTLDPYILFLPEREQSPMLKSHWTLNASNPVFLSAAADWNISVRAHSRHTYWSSGEIPESGAWFRVSFPEPTPVHKIILFHGTKVADYPRNNRVIVTNSLGVERSVGSLQYDPLSRTSSLTLEERVRGSSVRIETDRSEDGTWLTIFELWIF